MAPLKVVNIGGYGHFGGVLDQIDEMDDAVLAAYAPAFEGEDMAKIKKNKIVAGGVAAFGDYRKMLADVRPDVAVVSTRIDQIAQPAIDAARAGCHLICEKPMGIEVDDLKAIHRAVRESDVRLIAMLNMRAVSAMVAARKFYRSGALGEAVLVNVRKSYIWGNNRPQWFGKRELYGGTIGWIGIHALDIIHYITGLEFETVAAMQSNRTHPERPDCEDNCALLFELSNGAHATVSLDYCRPSTAPTHGDDWVRIVGSKGVLEANQSTKSCRAYIEDDKEPIEVPLGENLKMYESFLLSLAGKADFQIQRPADPFLLAHACMRARDAADEGAMMTIERGIWG